MLKSLKEFFSKEADTVNANKGEEASNELNSSRSIHRSEFNIPVGIRVLQLIDQIHRPTSRRNVFVY